MEAMKLCSCRDCCQQLRQDLVSSQAHLSLRGIGEARDSLSSSSDMTRSRTIEVSEDVMVCSGLCTRLQCVTCTGILLQHTARAHVASHDRLASLARSLQSLQQLSSAVSHDIHKLERSMVVETSLSPSQVRNKDTEQEGADEKDSGRQKHSLQGLRKLKSRWNATKPHDKAKRHPYNTCSVARYQCMLRESQRIRY